MIDEARVFSLLSNMPHPALRTAMPAMNLVTLRGPVSSQTPRRGEETGLTLAGGRPFDTAAWNRPR
jgi:hypothetical protein